jgi:hypothetical protein
MTDSNALDQITALIDQQWQQTPNARLICEVPLALWKEGLAYQQMKADENETEVWSAHAVKRENYVVRGCPVVVGSVARCAVRK